MSNYTVTTDFAAKDSLPSGNTGKIIKGSDFSTEFNNLATVSAEKADKASPTFTGTVVIPTATITTANTATANITTANVSGNVDMPDDAKVLLGNGDDLKLYHDETHSYIEDSGTGGLKLLTSSLLVKNPADDEFMIKGTPDGSVDLYYNNGKKLETTETGVKVQGALVASSKIGIGIDVPEKPLHIFSATTDVVARIESGDATAGLEVIDATSTAQFKVAAGTLTVGTDTDGDVAGSDISVRVSNNEKMNIADDLIVIKEVTRINDDKGLSFGNGSDLTVTHVSSGNLNTVQNNNDRNMVLNGGSFTFQNQAADEKLLELTADGAVTLFNNGVQKANTFGFGFQVAGRLEVDTPSTNTDETVIFKKDNTVCGGVRTTAGQFASIAIGSADTGIIFQNSSATDSIRPWDITGNQNRSGAIDLGASGAFWNDIYATNGTINTSDATEKQSIEELTEAETRVAQACKGLIRKFKWNSAVEKKGIEGARYHFGVIAQDLQAAFEAEGLDAGDYGLFISSTWTDDNGVEQTRLGVRYTELLAFIIGGLV